MDADGAAAASGLLARLQLHLLAAQSSAHHTDPLQCLCAPRARDPPAPQGPAPAQRYRWRVTAGPKPSPCTCMRVTAAGTPCGHIEPSGSALSGRYENEQLRFTTLPNVRQLRCTFYACCSRGSSLRGSNRCRWHVKGRETNTPWRPFVCVCSPGATSCRDVGA